MIEKFQDSSKKDFLRFVRFSEAFLFAIFLPMYCDQNLLKFKKLTTATIGETMTEINKGPINVRGTTPGKS